MTSILSYLAVVFAYGIFAAIMRPNEFLWKIKMSLMHDKVIVITYKIIENDNCIMIIVFDNCTPLPPLT